jgi:glycosyltransferase involved in cell wall biosynthesis
VDAARDRTSSHLVDVGIPVWGDSAYLEHAVASIEGQTLRSWRLHLAQDGPAEPSVERLVAGTGDPRIYYSASGRTLGAPTNKTRLLRLTDAPYVALLDHDDLWGPDFLLRRVEFLETHPDCGFVFSPSVTIDADGADRGRNPCLLPDGVHSTDELIPRLLRWGGIPGGTVVARRAAYLQVGAEFCAGLPRTYDYEMWVRLALRFPVGYIGVWDAYWRRHGASASFADVRGYDEEYELLAVRLCRLLAVERPDLLPGTRFWRRKVSSLLLMKALDALEAGDRTAARKFLLRILSRDPGSAIDARVLWVVLGLTGGVGSDIVTKIRQIRHERR